MMCNDLINAVWELDVRPPGRKFVLMALADRANEEGVCWPSQEWLSHACGMSRRMVMKHLRSLESKGLVVRIGYHKRARAYQLTIEPGDASTPEPEFEGTVEPEFSEPEFTLEPQFAHEVNQGSHFSGTRVPPNPQEPSLNLQGGVGEKRRASRLPDDWKLDEAGRGYARQKGFQDSAIDDMADNFAEHWQNKTGKASTKLDWSRAWQTWVRNQAKWDGGRRASKASGQHPATDAEVIMTEMAQQGDRW